MIAFARKNLTIFYSKHISPPSVCTLYLHYYSTSICDLLEHKHGFPPEFASRVAPELTRVKNPENAVSVLAFFKQSGFSNAQLEIMLKYGPRFLMRSLEKGIKPKIQLFQQEGFSSGEICKIISSNPPILDLSVENNIVPSLSVLKNILDCNSKVAKVVKRFPGILTASLENTLLPNVEFLKSCGVPMERIQMNFVAYPRSSTIKPKVMRTCAEKAKEMGLNPSSIPFIYAIRTLAQMGNEAWELKLQGFRNLGFSNYDIVAMFRKDPRAFSVSLEKVKKVKEVLLASGKFNMSCIVNQPNSFSLSVENRYIPRLRMLKVLEDRNLIKNWPSLATLSTLSDDRFFKNYISPYLDEVSYVDLKEFCICQKGD